MRILDVLATGVKGTIGFVVILVMIAFGINDCVRVGDQGWISYKLKGPPPPVPMTHWTDEEREGFVPFEASIRSFKRAAALLEEKARTGPALEAIDLTDVAAELRDSASLAAKVPVATLDRAHPELASHFRSYQIGLQQVIDGLDRRDDHLVELGTSRTDEFAMWCNAHADEISANQFK